MSGRRSWRKRPETPREPAAIIRALRACREAMIGVHDQVRPFGPVYSLASAVVTAIDSLADALTGQPRYFSVAARQPALSA